MIITCPECQSQYKLDPSVLGADGREVRCVSCNHTWFQVSGEKGPAAPVVANEAEPEKPAAAPEALPPAKESLDAALDKLLEQDSAVLESILSGVGAAKKEFDVPTVSVSASRHAQTDLPVVTHNPFGVSAAMFGGLVFCLCTFLTMTGLFLAKGTIVNHWPQISLLYKAIGFDIKAPGEGLRISEVTAERRINGQEKVLLVQGKMTNMTEHDLAYPVLHMIIRDKQETVVKEMDLRSGSDKLSSGEAMPIMVQLNEVPAGSSKVEVRVKGN